MPSAPMLLDRARSEAMAEYADAHNALNVMARVTWAGLHVLQGMVAGVDGAEKLGKLVDAVGKTAWNKQTFPAPFKRVGEARSSLAGLAVTTAVGAFDWYTIRLGEDLARFSALGGAGGPYAHMHKSLGSVRDIADAPCCRAAAEQHGRDFTLAGRVEELCDNVLLVKRPTELPVFHFFRLLRNCVAHAGGRADQALVDQAVAPATKQAFEEFNKTTSAETPKLPVVCVGKVVPIDVELAILASALCFRLAEALDEAAVRVIGQMGFVRMAAHYAVLVSSHAARAAVPPPRSVPKAVNSFLESRLRVRGTSERETVFALRDLQLRKHLELTWLADGRRPPKRPPRPRR